MIEVYKNLYVGNQDDYENNVKLKSDWNIIHACKEPYHRDALGYTRRAAAKNHPEYLIASRENRLILNLVDVDDMNYIPKIVIDAALAFINESLKINRKVLLHCNQGFSRSPSIAFLYLAQQGYYRNLNFEAAELQFMQLYPNYKPAKGIRGFAKTNWMSYRE